MLGRSATEPDEWKEAYPMTTRIDVDFNARGRGGLVKVSRRRADGNFSVGDDVVLYDSDETDMQYTATIVFVDDQGRGWAQVHWQPVSQRAWSPGQWTAALAASQPMVLPKPPKLVSEPSMRPATRRRYSWSGPITGPSLPTAVSTETPIPA